MEMLGTVKSAFRASVAGVNRNIVLPLIEEMVRKFLTEAEKTFVPVCESFKSYLDRKYLRLSYAQLIAKPNQKTLLKDIYVPMSINKRDRTHNSTESYVIDKYPSELIEKWERILIVDKAGMGKSTMSKFMFLSAVNTGYVIPVFIELRNLSKEHTIIDDIYDQMNELHGMLNKDRLMLFIESGQFVFFLDGYDEIPLKEKESVTRDIERFIDKAYKNKFVITSREEEGLTAFGSFQAYSIKKLEKEEAYQLLRKYENSETTEELIRTLEQPQNEQIHEFLDNPLLVSLLLITFNYEKDIPTHKHLFYKKLYDALFESHDISKGQSYHHDKASGINDVDKFEQVLRFLAKEGTRDDKLGYPREIFIKKLNKIKEIIGFEFDSAGFINDILKVVPLFTQDGIEIRWAHKSLREYFTAKYIHVETSAERPLKALVNKNLSKNRNLLSLYYDIDQAGFDQFVTLPYFKEYIEFYEKKADADQLSMDEVQQQRLCNIFMNDIYISYNNEVHNRFDDFYNNKELKENYLSKRELVFTEDYHLTSLIKRNTIIYEILLEKKRKEIHDIQWNMTRKEISNIEWGIRNELYNKDYTKNKIDIRTLNRKPSHYKYLNYRCAGSVQSGKFLSVEECRKFIEEQEKIVSLKDDFDNEW